VRISEDNSCKFALTDTDKVLCLKILKIILATKEGSVKEGEGDFYTPIGE